MHEIFRLYSLLPVLNHLDGLMCYEGDSKFLHPIRRFGNHVVAMNKW